MPLPELLANPISVFVRMSLRGFFRIQRIEGIEGREEGRERERGGSGVTLPEHGSRIRRIRANTSEPAGGGEAAMTVKAALNRN